MSGAGGGGAGTRINAEGVSPQEAVQEALQYGPLQNPGTAPPHRHGKEHRQCRVDRLMNSFVMMFLVLGRPQL